jgi:hypothetical protein
MILLACRERNQASWNLENRGVEKCWSLEGREKVPSAWDLDGCGLEEHLSLEHREVILLQWGLECGLDRYRSPLC